VPVWQNTTLNDTKLREKLELCMGDGMSLVIVQVEEDIDPTLDPALEKPFVVKGKKLQVIVSDKALDYDPKFRMLYFITRWTTSSFARWRTRVGAVLLHRGGVARELRVPDVAGPVPRPLHALDGQAREGVAGVEARAEHHQDHDVH
jgi:hypothetical protein